VNLTGGVDETEKAMKSMEGFTALSSRTAQLVDYPIAPNDE
jgi:hypothetical protein